MVRGAATGNHPRLVELGTGVSNRSIAFRKMHALANDFVVVNAIEQSFDVSEDWIRKIGNRHRGVGFDQLLIVRAAKDSEADFGLDIYNSDGHQAEQCGNGTLCVARFAVDEKLTQNSSVSFKTLGGLVKATILARQVGGDVQVQAELGVPSIDPSCVPFVTDQPELSYEIELALAAPQTLVVTPVALGNPHVVVFPERDVEWDLEDAVKAIQGHECFPASVNVEFVHIVARNHIQLRIFERGAGETMACGTGACAAMIAANLRGYTNNCVRVEQAGGSATVTWHGREQPITLTAVASQAFDGVIQLG